MWSQLWGYTLKMKTSQGQNTLLPFSHNTPQQMDHLVWKQNTFCRSSFCFASIAPISYIAFLVHMLFLIFSDLVSIRLFSLALFIPFHPPFPLLFQLSGIVTWGSSEDAYISRCISLQTWIWEELAFGATVQDRAESNTVRHFVTSLPEHQLACI